MTDDVRKALDEHVMAALVVVLTAGYVVRDRAGALSVQKMADGRFGVGIQGSDLGLLTERDDVFEDAQSAAAYFLDLCDEPSTR